MKLLVAMLPLVASRDADVVLMHRRGLPENTFAGPAYTDVVEEVRQFLLERAAVCLAAGVKRERIALDPGIGFGKTVAQNFSLLARQAELLPLGFALLAGWSRKSSLGAVTGREVPAARVAAEAQALYAPSVGLDPRAQATLQLYRLGVHSVVDHLGEIEASLDDIGVRRSKGEKP